MESVALSVWFRATDEKLLLRGWKWYYFNESLERCGFQLKVIKAQVAQAQNESFWNHDDLCMVLVICGIILKMAVNIKEFYGSSGNFEKIKTLYLFTWSFPASCVIIFVICCDLSEFFYSRASNSRSGNLNSHTNPLFSRPFWPLCNTIPLELMMNRPF